MTSSHSFRSLEAEKGPISFTFGHTHTGMVDTKSPPPPPWEPPGTPGNPPPSHPYLWINLCTFTYNFQMPVTKVHCWYQFKFDGKASEAQDRPEADCSYHKPTCKAQTSYKTVSLTRQVPMQIKVSQLQ